MNCDATFKSSTQLKRHTANAHCSRPYKCPHCPHRSKNKTNLERHVAFHTSNKDAFQCLHCGRKFAFKNSMKKHLEKGRCSVLKELEKAQKNKNGKIGSGTNTFKNYLEATIMRHLQQTPKSPTLSPPTMSTPTLSTQLHAPIPSPHNTLASLLSQPHVDTGSRGISVIHRSNGNDMITSMDTSPSALLNFTASPHNSISTTSSSLISSYNNHTASICSDRNLQSVNPMASNENHVPNDIVYQFDTSGNSINN